tara:strand:- start:1909 stop:2097 length:189 start_codon:yes stop_codon:yes gene_type:complete
MHQKYLLKFATAFSALAIFSGVATAASSNFPNSAKSVVIASIFGMIAVLFLSYILLKYGGEA